MKWWEKTVGYYFKWSYGVNMKFIWELASFVLVLLVALLVATVGLLTTDMLYALLSGSVVGFFTMLFQLSQGRPYSSAAASMFFSLVGALTAFIIAWAVLLIFTSGIMGSAALALDLLIGIIGASASLRFVKPFNGDGKTND